jgi:hypothetical protein
VSAAPKAAHKSPAQVKANKAFAAGGRAAQARHRAAYEKSHHGKKPPRSKAQKSASRKWAAAGRAAQAAARSGKKSPASKKKAALPVTQYHCTGPLIWLPGCLNERPVCYAVAIANHLLAATGIAASDADILALHDLAGGDNGATIDLALEAAAEYGLAGVKLASFEMGDEIIPGMVVGVQTRRGYHAVLSHPYGLISWGLLMPRFGEPEEAWGLDWAIAARQEETG